MAESFENRVNCWLLGAAARESVASLQRSLSGPSKDWSTIESRARTLSEQIDESKRSCGVEESAVPSTDLLSAVDHQDALGAALAVNKVAGAIGVAVVQSANPLSPTDVAVVKLQEVKAVLEECAAAPGCEVCHEIIAEEASHVGRVGDLIAKVSAETDPEPEILAELLAIQAEATGTYETNNEEADHALAEKGMPPVTAESYLNARIASGGS